MTKIFKKIMTLSMLIFLVSCRQKTCDFVLQIENTDIHIGSSYLKELVNMGYEIGDIQGKSFDLDGKNFVSGYEIQLSKENDILIAVVSAPENPGSISIGAEGEDLLGNTILGMKIPEVKGSLKINNQSIADKKALIAAFPDSETSGNSTTIQINNCKLTYQTVEHTNSIHIGCYRY